MYILIIFPFQGIQPFLLGLFTLFHSNVVFKSVVEKCQSIIGRVCLITGCV